MDHDDFWPIIERARDLGGPLHEALETVLAGMPAEVVVDYRQHYDEHKAALYRWDVWAAAYLIGGGCSDDSFMDFRAGIIARGRESYQIALTNPDGLAALSLVQTSALAGDDGEDIFYEEFTYAPSHAYERITGNDGLFEAQEQRHPQQSGEHDMGEDFDFDDSAEMHRRLPRLAALFLGSSE
ncbi:DUF4240 domain-containing protein [Actinomadura rugatobispora]|uniref:DUF4240 domain-containing protein n=1 Tax=Actinomadura rugatobispora TaxID=1994 RepID=A0ABW1A5L4_9ACTN|nr:DUF4240 domain-containing protein [Actinomadura rugatobispora]